MDRRLVISLGVVVLVMVVTVHTWYSFFVGLGLAFVGVPWLKRFGTDPMGVDAFRRHVNRRGHLGAYSAQSRYTSVAPKVRAQVKG